MFSDKLLKILLLDKKKKKKTTQTETSQISKGCWLKLLWRYSFLCLALWEEFTAVIWDFPFNIFLSFPSIINIFTDLLLPPSNLIVLFETHMSIKIIAKTGLKNGLNSPDYNVLFQIRDPLWGNESSVLEGKLVTVSIGQPRTIPSDNLSFWPLRVMVSLCPVTATLLLLFYRSFHIFTWLNSYSHLQICQLSKINLNMSGKSCHKLNWGQNICLICYFVSI